jgi:murein DD-endopeptidase MepM/ murein hydrolase activator NlpD
VHQYDNESGNPRRDSRVTSHRVRSKLAGRAPLVAAAAVGVLGFGLAGISAVVGTDGGSATVPTAATAASAQAQERADAAGRADRSQRSAAATPPAQAAAQAAPSKAAPSPAVPAPAAPATTKAAPKTTAPKPKATTKRAASWVSPMPGAENTSCFGMRWGVLHAGLDLASPENTPIRAVGAGTVVATGWAYTGYGISVVIDHGNGWLTHYAHQNRTAVSVGDKVKPGQVIGYEGSTGDSTGPHLHFEVHQGMWNQVDPGPWMRARGVDIGC